MRRVCRTLLCLVAMAASSGKAADPGRLTALERRPLILAHYLPWYVAKPTSPVWGWHWTMNAFDPDKTAKGGRAIASHYYPLVGPYDSADPAVLEYHLLLMKLAGIDGVVADWYGRADHLDYRLIHRNTEALLKACATLGLKFAVCYEDQTIPKLVAANKLPAADRVKQAKEDIAWLRQHWFTHPAYVRHGGKPLLLSFGADGLTDDEWTQALASSRDAVTYLSEHRRRPSAAGAFDWPVPKNYPGAQERYYREVPAWTVAMPVAFPRFHDVYAEARVHASWGRIPDIGGRTLATTLERAFKSGAPFVQIATWNDWGEGTGIEPTQEFGYRDLETVQRLRRAYVDAAWPVKADDLRLPQRLLLARRQPASSPRTATLDAAAKLMANGTIDEGRRLVHRLEGEGKK